MINHRQVFDTSSILGSRLTYLGLFTLVAHQASVNCFHFCWLCFVVCLALQLSSKNNGLGLLFKTILRHLFRFLSIVAMDGKDGNRVKLVRLRCVCDWLSKSRYEVLLKTSLELSKAQIVLWVYRFSS